MVHVVVTVNDQNEINTIILTKHSDQVSFPQVYLGVTRNNKENQIILSQ